MSEVNHPSHYNQYGVEVIKMLERYLSPEEYYGYLLATEITYRLRAPYKGTEELDLQKAEWYKKEAERFAEDRPTIMKFSYNDFVRFVKEYYEIDLNNPPPKKQ